ncbi:DUF4169 family protein [Plastorhodobacter daqingensis]|uniref:DUF4169 family protein n=1 Tax=Plastorhodobacter daqingensis TaxID=1387281 RepID=A0ABW2ULH2_9RHOB
MGDLVNLRQARKQRERAAQRARGDENAARFGRSKAEREQDAARAEKARAHLDGHRRDPDTPQDTPE